MSEAVNSGAVCTPAAIPRADHGDTSVRTAVAIYGADASQAGTAGKASLGFAAGAALKELQGRMKAGNTGATGRPSRLPLTAIAQRAELFQPRQIDHRHVADLARVIRDQGEVDPITVMQVGEDVVLIDGHHRVEAYELAGRGEGVPVRFFEGTLEDAVLEAGRANSKAKLTMTKGERQDYAWRLVLLDRYSKEDTAKASGVSTSQVANMRKVRKTLGMRAASCASWVKARKLAVGAGEELDAEGRQAWVERIATAYADRMTKTFGDRLTVNMEVAASALAIHFGRRIGELAEELKVYLPDEDGEDDAF